MASVSCKHGHAGRGRWWAALLGLAATGAAGCHELVGVQDWHPADSPDGILRFDSEPAEERSDGGGCGEGSWRCEEALLQQCAQGGWLTLKTCASATLCDALERTCIAASCSSGQVRCDGATLLVCNPWQSGWDVAADCRTPTLCNAPGRRCEPAACEPQEAKCEGAGLWVCAPELDGWELAASCATAELCDSAARTCHAPACEAAERRCEGKQLLVCDAGRTGWVTLAHCSSPQQCDVKQGVCTP
jgi:hypothetical protein